MKRTPERYKWEGASLTAKEVAAKVPAYKADWIEKALKDGCTSMADLARREHRAKARSHRGAIKGRQEAERQGMAKLLVGKGQP